MQDCAGHCAMYLRRATLVCRLPVRRRRALMLYKWEPVDLFCHRDAIRPRPTYTIQRVVKAARVITQRWALRRKMGDTLSDLTGEPIKPKWMRWRTYERYAARDAGWKRRTLATWLGHWPEWACRAGLNCGLAFAFRLVAAGVSCHW